METENIRQDRASVVGASRRYVSVLALVLMLLSAAGCSAQARAPKGAQHATATTVPTAVPTATPPPSLPLHPVPLPSGFSVQTGSLAVSPVDGKVAWACTPMGDNAFKLWVTTSAGATWQAAGMVQAVTPVPTDNGCRMVADARDTQAAIFSVAWGGTGEGAIGSHASISYFTRDGGQHWVQSHGWVETYSVETNGAVAYALVTVTTPPPPQQTSKLPPSASSSRLAAPGPGAGYQEHSAFIVSSDGMQTWRELHIGDPATLNSVHQFWHSPTTDDLFAATFSGELWHSRDGGMNWTQHPDAPDTVGSQISMGAWVVDHQAWMFCRSRDLSSVTLCSTDSGATWSEIPALPGTLTCVARCRQDSMALGTKTVLCSMFALRPDGSILAACPPMNGAPQAGQVVLYRLALGANGWTMLGVVPSLPIVVSANGIIWCNQEHYGEWDTLALPV